MRITIESTGQICKVDGALCRVWEGTTERGAKCKLFVVLIAAHIDQDHVEFGRELRDRMPPGELVAVGTVLG